MGNNINVLLDQSVATVWRSFGCIFSCLCQVMLTDMENSKKTLEEELQKTSEVRISACDHVLWGNMDINTCTYRFSSQKACVTVEENIRLKSRLQAAEADVGHRPASTAEQDYEEVIQLLEAEIRDLKNQLAGKRQARGVDTSKASVTISASSHAATSLLIPCLEIGALYALYLRNTSHGICVV